MRLEQLEYLLAIQKYQSMTAAAENLHVAQQSVSTAIKSLESEMNTELVERGKKGSFLTSSGEEVAEFARDIFARWEEITEKYTQQKFNMQSSQEITLYIQPNYLVSPDLAKLTTNIRKYIPNAKININATDSNNIIHCIKQDENAIGLLMVKAKDFSSIEKQFHAILLARHYVGFSANKHSEFIISGNYFLRNLRNQNIFIMQGKDSPENLLLEIIDQYHLEQHNAITYNVPSVVLGEYLKNNYGVFLGLFSQENINNSSATDIVQRVVASENIQRNSISITTSNHLYSILQKIFIS